MSLRGSKMGFILAGQLIDGTLLAHGVLACPALVEFDMENGNKGCAPLPRGLRVVIFEDSSLPGFTTPADVENAQTLLKLVGALDDNEDLP